MTHYILCGETAVMNFNNENWTELQSDVLLNHNGELISFETSDFKDGIHELLNSLRGWNDYIQLSEQDLSDIENNTKIEILRPKHTKEAIYWSTEDFDNKADQNFCEMQKDNLEEFKHLTSWEQFYDKTKFPDALKSMIKKHDYNYGITWETLDFYIGECEIK